MEGSCIVHVHEIRSHVEQMRGQSVRVLGRVTATDPDSPFVTIAYGHDHRGHGHAQHELLVDTRLIGSLARHGAKSLFQFVAQVEDIQEDIAHKNPFVLRFLNANPHIKVFLNARIMRSMDGLDINLFEKALVARRVFDAQRAQLNF
ncbi:telomere-capping, CST complex subunit-domain-containing protein [Chytriomyces sp. MP71]|nr:telomere-capping, CST complex subunit-domain-containing protein [Chytriomyces sp. MP71]